MMRFARAAAVVVPVLVGGYLAVGVSRYALAGPAVTTSPAGKEVAEVLVTGNKVRATQDIVNVFGLRPEQRYDEEAVRNGTKKLYDKGWFTPNGIVIRTVERPDQKVNVILEVSELTNFIDD